VENPSKLLKSDKAGSGQSLSAVINGFPCKTDFLLLLAILLLEFWVVGQFMYICYLIYTVICYLSYRKLV
jgi:hypothetical protein